MTAAARVLDPMTAIGVRLAAEADLPGVLRLHAQPELDGENATPLKEETVIFRRMRGCYKLAPSSNARRKRAHEFYERLGFRQHGLSFVIDPGAGA